MSSQAKKVQQQQQVYNRRSYGDEIRRQQQQVETSGNRSGSGFNTPDYTTGSDTGGRNGQGVKPTTFEFPSYESFHRLRGTSREVKPSGGAGGGVTHRHFVARQAVAGRKDSSDEDTDDGEVNRSRPAVAARRPVMDRPRPRSAHFGDLEDHDNDDFPFQRRHEVDHRLRRQSTRQSIELGRLKMQEKDDEIKPAVSTISTFGATGNPMSAAGGAGRFTGEGGPVEGGLTRRQSEMASSRLRDDVIEAKVVLLGSQGVGKTSLAKRFTQGDFSPQSATVNASLFTTKSVHDGVGVRLQIWDTCGEGAHAALILYDISDPQSFEDVRDWIHELRAVSEETDIFVVGAKYDLAKSGKRRVARRYARWKLAEWLGVRTGEDLRYLSVLNGGGGDGIKAEVDKDRPRSGKQMMTRSQTQNTLNFPSAMTTTVRTPATTTYNNNGNPILPTVVTSPITAPQSRPNTYRFLSLLSIPTSRSSTSALLIEDEESDALASSITLQPGSRFTSGQRANSTSSATALMAMSVTLPITAHTPTTTSAGNTHKLPTSGSTSGLNLMSATSSSIGMPRRKSEDWSMNKAKDEFLRALGTTTTATTTTQSQHQEESEAAKALRRTSGELLRPFSADAAADGRNVLAGKGEVAEYAVGDESEWGKLIVGTNVRIGETSSKTGKGVVEVFASLTSQLVLKRRQIRMEQARRAREVVDLSGGNAASPGHHTSGKGKTRMRKTANCCT
ncbi:hypothetical protein QFC24_000787 [Naganishia onofrii]|uniref:Uncharacterized protein n=1 Tax=Naganishia onofrii TaxID=1851511 RepID=A0ACC2XVL3_9TREE|nr:hypothetical protein QFC24_000787 [Naganishia onofrii]